MQSITVDNTATLKIEHWISSQICTHQHCRGQRLAWDQPESRMGRTHTRSRVPAMQTATPAVPPRHPQQAQAPPQHNHFTSPVHWARCQLCVVDYAWVIKIETGIGQALRGYTCTGIRWRPGEDIYGNMLFCGLGQRNTWCLCVPWGEVLVEMYTFW